MTQQVSRLDVSEVPPGMVRLAKYGTIPAGQWRDRELISFAPGVMYGFPDVSFAYETRGYTCAGSMARWQEAHWSVSYQAGNTVQGQSFADTPEGEAKARALYAKWTDPALVAQARQDSATDAVKCAAFKAEQDAEARVSYLAACAERGLNPATKKARNTFQWFRGSLNAVGGSV